MWSDDPDHGEGVREMSFFNDDGHLVGFGANFQGVGAFLTA